MKISFVIPAYNEEHFLGTCLGSLLAEIGRNGKGLETEIIVVNNASQDKTREVGLSFPGVRVVDEARRGTNSARDRGFRESTGERVAFLDADSRVPAGWIARQEKIFSESQKIVAVSGPYDYYDANPWEKSLMTFLWWFAALAAEFTGSVANGGNFIVKRSALEKINGFNTALTFYGDDTDMARRLSKEGKVVFHMSFCMHSSYRRYRKLGLVKTLTLYVMNFLSEIFFKRPFIAS